MVVENELVIERRTINRENRRYQDKSTNNEDKRRNQFAGSRRIHWYGSFLPPHSKWKVSSQRKQGRENSLTTRGD